MKRFLIPIAILMMMQANAQTGYVGIGTDSPLAVLHVADSSVVFTAKDAPPPTAGEPPVRGPGRRMMWYADKAALRYGYLSVDAWKESTVGQYSFAGGFDTEASGNGSFALGFTTLASGGGATALGFNSFAMGDFSISGGHHAIAGGHSSIALGFQPIAEADNSVAIGEFVQAKGRVSTAFGGGTQSKGFFSTAMGRNTIASGDTSTAMGHNTSAAGKISTAMGNSTSAGGKAATSMGSNTSAGGEAATAMGMSTSASGLASTAIGESTVASGQGSFASGHSTLAGGTYSTAMGDHTAALGTNSTAMGAYASTGFFNGCFLVGDNSSTNSMTPNADNQMRMRFAGGYTLYSNSARSAGVKVAAGGGSWSAVSDVRLKENFDVISGEEILAKVSGLPITSWNYKAQPATQRHIGPMAQDFYKAFRLDGEGADTTINTMDISGVNMVAIQALEKRTADLKQENEDLRKQNVTLEARLKKLEMLMEEMK